MEHFYIITINADVNKHLAVQHTSSGTVIGPASAEEVFNKALSDAVTKVNNNYKTVIPVSDCSVVSFNIFEQSSNQKTANL